MEENKDFCILHNIEGTQFLVDTTFNHDTDEFELTIKFWFEYINGYTSATLKWHADKKDDFNKLFDKLKDVEYAKVWLNGLKNQMI